MDTSSNDYHSVDSRDSIGGLTPRVAEDNPNLMKKMGIDNLTQSALVFKR